MPLGTFVSIALEAVFKLLNIPSTLTLLFEVNFKNPNICAKCGVINIYATLDFRQILNGRTVSRTKIPYCLECMAVVPIAQSTRL